ncbi:MAG TPA: flagellar basal body L-ring protein FlgH [Caulobacteraceae bacterium]|jgi:flagellar L-ring protein precursor FlgH|nr:flagellar basal body L-ring protein FlgH [Caulobacteraceae bacterium]
MRRPLLIVLLAAAGPLAACASVKSSVIEAAQGPTLTPMSHPMVPPATRDYLSIAASARDAGPQPASANSLWRSGARAFFDDQRARRVGDILTVLINIDDSAKTSNATTASKTSTNAAGITNFFGLETLLAKVLPPAFNPAQAINTNASLVAAGTGGITRQEQITLTIAAVVTNVLPNGNLEIEGRQEVRTNNDTRILTVAGIVRPEDITSTNTILHTQIAEARIDYGGKGDIAAVQKTPAGTALMQRWLPF